MIKKGDRYICVSNIGSEGCLTIGEIYVSLYDYGTNYHSLWTTSDNNIEDIFPLAHFKTISEYRNSVINNILD